MGSNAYSSWNTDEHMHGIPKVLAIITIIVCFYIYMPLRPDGKNTEIYPNIPIIKMLTVLLRE